MRPGKSFAISAHEFPNCACAARKMACSDLDHGCLLILGSNCVCIVWLSPTECNAPNENVQFSGDMLAIDNFD